MPKAITKKKPPEPKPKPKPDCAPVCEVNNPDKYPFQASVQVSLPAGTEGQNGFVTLPAGKRLVIEYVSGQAFLPSGQKALFSGIVSLRGRSTGRWHYLESSTTGRFGSQDCFRYGRMVKLYADAGVTVMLRTDRDSPAGAGLLRMTLSGHLISS